MHKIDMPAGATIRLTATAGADAGVHRWAVRVHGADPTAEPHARLTYGSQIGGQDRDQRIDIPIQDVDCRVEVQAQHVAEGGEWRDDGLTVLDDTPSRLDLGFFDSAQRFADLNGLLLSFAFGRPYPQT